jgi:hypothetical protein
MSPATCSNKKRQDACKEIRTTWTTTAIAMLIMQICADTKIRFRSTNPASDDALKRKKEYLQTKREFYLYSGIRIPAD